MIKNIICEGKDASDVFEMDKIKHSSIGFSYTIDLFYAALLFYYDRFHNFDIASVKKIFIWAFMIRIDMENLGYASINKYAIGEDGNGRYTNAIAMFSKISTARMHTEISDIKIKFPDRAKSRKWDGLYDNLMIL